MLPDITIVMTTYFTDSARKELAENALLSWNRFLKYDGTLRLHIADDGSTVSSLLSYCWGDPVTYSRQERQGVGASLNRGFEKAFESSPLVLYAVDDWRLMYEEDLTPWAQVLMDREDVGMVRLGPPHPNIRGTVEAFSEHWNSWGLRLERYGFFFGHRPAVYHKRMIDAYGWFDENVSALECERLYVEKCAHTAGPDVVLSLSSPWWHTSVKSLSALEPGKEHAPMSEM